MKSFNLLVLSAVGATASTFPGNDVSFGIRRQPSFLKKLLINNKHSKQSLVSDNQSTTSSLLSLRGGAFDPYIGDIYYSEVSPEGSRSEQASYDAAINTYPQNNNNNNNNNNLNNNDSPIVSTSQALYEDGCFVSSDSVGPVEPMFNSFFNNGFGEYYSDHDEDDDDDDDDDNDGHSSMLANGSLTRSRRMQSYSYEVQFQ